jgi:hypothetical protein
MPPAGTLLDSCFSASGGEDMARAWHSSENIGRDRRAAFAILAFAALFAQSSVAQPGGVQSKVPCDRACLTGFVDSYFKALLAHDARALPQAAQARITENGAEKPLANTFWDGAAETVFRFDIVNTRRGDTGTEAVIRNADGSKTMYMLRLKVKSKPSRLTKATPTGFGIQIASKRFHPHSGCRFASPSGIPTSI